MINKPSYVLPTDWYYVLTDRRETSYEGWLNAANAKGGLSKLGIPSGTAGLVLIVDSSGKFFYLLPHTDKGNGFRNCFCAITAASVWDSIENTTVAAKDIERSSKRTNTSNMIGDYALHAIVHVDYEEQFKQVAVALGLEPEKVKEDYF